MLLEKEEKMRQMSAMTVMQKLKKWRNKKYES